MLRALKFLPRQIRTVNGEINLNRDSDSENSDREKGRSKARWKNKVRAGSATRSEDSHTRSLTPQDSQ